MVRIYKRKTDRGKYGGEKLKSALNALKDQPLKQVSRQYGIPARTLRRHRDLKVKYSGVVVLGPKQPVLSHDVERLLIQHITHMERSLYGLSTVDVRRLAFELAERLGIKHNFKSESKMAGRDWLQGFFSRHPDIAIRIPQGTNIARAVGFNKAKVEQFFKLYKTELNRCNYTASRVWNVDETGITNVQKPGKIIATKGIRQVGKVTSGERGTTVTVICAINAAGTYLPPIMIFPRKRMAESLMTGAPPQSVGYCSANGWTDCNLFVQWLEHFVDVTNASVNVPQLIILDGHHSHKTIAAVEYARNHGITMITLPPHCTHKMQPLDRTYFKSLKSAYNAASDSWMVANPGKRISLHDMAALFGKAFLRSATADKAVNGFRTCGLWPYDETVFTDNDFAASMVTDEDPLPPTDAPDQSTDAPGQSTDAPGQSTDAPGQSTDAPAIAGQSTDAPSIAGQSTDALAIAGQSTDMPAIATQSTGAPAIAGQSTDAPGQSTDAPAITGQSTDARAIAGQSTDAPGQSTDAPAITGQSTDARAITGQSTDARAIAGQSTDAPGQSTDAPAITGQSTDARAIAGQSTDAPGQSTYAPAIAGQSTDAPGQSTDAPAITGQSTDVPAVAGKSTDAPAVAGTSNEVPTVSGQSTHVTLVAGQSAATNMFATSPDTRPLSC
ncbi:flocculation protein FLO11-like [Gigantopelta aegis]|uniref:flocculation protein FLO11-like n=1 Tax=Gigantopelta aegis TaxID=1735272 RepID=UPI001B888EC5|nr:flocculation protein FLO11-like [Gigantopelta aegis]